MNAASRARERRKLRGWAASALTPGIPGLLEEREAEVQNSCRAPPKLRSTEQTMENGQKHVSDQQIVIHVEISCVRPQKNVSGEVTLPKKSKRKSKKWVQFCSRECVNIFIKARWRVCENLNNLLMLWNVTPLNLDKKNCNHIIRRSIGDVLWD